MKAFTKFMKQRLSKKGIYVDVEIRHVTSSENKNIGVDAWDYSSVYHATKQTLLPFIENEESADIWYCITPGTIAQQMSLVFIGKEFSPNSNNFIQVDKSRRKVSQCEIPFDFGKVVEKAIGERAAKIESGAMPINGKTPSFLSALRMADRIAQYPVTVLLTGESGTGKEVFARRIHHASGRKGKFIAVNCAMLSRETGVTELTGYFKGAYTGANETTPGYYEQAKDGTLFLDEIGDCPLDVQAELLRFLQPIGNEKPTTRHWKLKGTPPRNPTKVEKQFISEQSGDILVVAATNRDVRNPKTFRQDLFYRLETIQIRLPSLEERKRETDESHNIDDIRDLADSALDECNKAFGFGEQDYRRLSPEAYIALREHVWLGNIRELKNVITRLVVLSDEKIITAEAVRASLNHETIRTEATPKGTLEQLIAEMARIDVNERYTTFEDRMAEIKKIYCNAALKAANGNKKKAYDAIDIDHRTFKAYLS